VRIGAGDVETMLGRYEENDDGAIVHHLSRTMLAAAVVVLVVVVVGIDSRVGVEDGDMETGPALEP